MSREHYPIVFQFNGLEYRCIWYTDEKDGFLTQSSKLRTFRSEQEAVACCEEKNKQPADLEAIFLDIDLLRRELDQIEDTRTLDCYRFLTFWNMIGDAAYSLELPFYGDRKEMTPIYERVFYGTNPSALRKDGEYFTPTWTDIDLKVLQAVFRNGIQLLKSVL